MKFRSGAYLFLGPGFDPKIHRSTLKTSQGCFTSIGIDFHHKSAVIELAKELVLEGVQVIELCGGFGPEWVARVSEAVSHVVPIGSVYYGPEFRSSLLKLTR